ncbi:hypothetical protein F-S17_0242 [Faustovirus]|nr:hypothetical protein F-S17_0242 [Faustovirus]
MNGRCESCRSTITRTRDIIFMWQAAYCECCLPEIVCTMIETRNIINATPGTTAICYYYNKSIDITSINIDKCEAAYKMAIEFIKTGHAKARGCDITIANDDPPRYNGVIGWNKIVKIADIKRPTRLPFWADLRLLFF